MKTEKLYLKYFIRSHTIIGLFSLFLFYISCFFGALTLFLPYISMWETPSKHFKPTDNYIFNIDESLDDILKKNQFLTDKIEIVFPNFKDNRIQISALNQNSIYLNPHSNEVLPTKFEQKTVSDFLNILHFGGNIPYIGQPLMGLSSIGILFLILSGGLLVVYNKKKTKVPCRKSYKKKYLSWHKYLGVFLIPFIFVFALTGAFLGFMLFASTPYALSSSQFEQTNIRKLVAPIIFETKQIPKTNSTTVPMQKFSLLLQKAQQHYPQLHIQKAEIYNYNKKDSHTVFSGYLTPNKILSAKLNRLSITLQSATGDIIEKTLLEDCHIIKRTLSAFYYLHFISDETIILRIVFFILTLALLFCLILGYLIWAQRKLKHFHDIHYFNLLNRLCVALMVGVIPAVSFVFFLHWLLPFDTFDREVWIKGCFYCMWSFALFYSVYQYNIIKATKLFFGVSAFLLFGSVLLHGLKTHLYFWDSIKSHIMPIFYVDITLLLLGCMGLILALFLDKLPFIKRFNQEEIYRYDV